MLNREVGDADGAGLALGELGHGFWKNLLVNVQASCLSWVGSLTLPGVRDRDTVVKSDLAVAPGLLREQLAAILESDRPVDKVELQHVNNNTLARGKTGTYIEVLEIELSKRIVKSRLHLLGPVLVVP